MRMPGWKRLLRDSGHFKNQDLHDQMLDLMVHYEGTPSKPEDVLTWPNAACGSELKQRRAEKQFITALHSATDLSGGRHLFAATQQAIYELNEYAGEWRILGDGFGPSGADMQTRFEIRNIGDCVVFTNNFDKVLSYKIGKPHYGCQITALEEIEDLWKILKVERVAVLAAYKGLMFYMNVHMDGRRFANRIIWSDYNVPISVDPAKQDSIAGYIDLPAGEDIYSAVEMAGGLFVITNRGIYSLGLTGQSENPVGVDSVYLHANGHKCPAYKYLIASTGEQIYYLGRDGVYEYAPWYREPQLVKWLTVAAKKMVEEMQHNSCAMHTAGFNANTGEVFFSYIKSYRTYPTWCFVFKPAQSYAYYCDYGFTAFCNHLPDRRITVQDFLLSRAICDPANFNFVKEGIPTYQRTASTSPAYIINNEKIVFDGMEIENYFSANEAYQDSLCASFGDADFESQFCADCNTGAIFIGASAYDKTLKEFDPKMRREYLLAENATPPSTNGLARETTQGIYEKGGYKSIVTIGPIDFGAPIEDKLLTAYRLKGCPIPDTYPPVDAALRIGTSHVALDPNQENCGVTWRNWIFAPFQCPQTRTGQQYQQAGLAPGYDISRGQLNIKGQFIYIQLALGGKNNGEYTYAYGGSGFLTAINLEIKV